MIKCFFCGSPLYTEFSEGWLCVCGEFIHYGFEMHTEDDCEICSVENCPKGRNKTKNASNE